MKLSVILKYIDHASAPIKQTEQQFTSLSSAIERAGAYMDKINKTAQSLGKAGDSAKQLATPGIEFEQMMVDLSVTAGISGKDLARLGEAARQTGVSSGLGAAAALNAFSALAGQIDLSKTGIDGLIKLQNTTITLSQAAGISMTDAASTVTGTINQFGLQADQAGRLINVMAAGAKYGAAGIPQLAESFKTVGPTATSAGISIESTTGAIEVLSKSNLKGAQAGTVLHDIIRSMQTSLGTDFKSTSLEEALAGLQPHLQDTAYMTQIFGEANVKSAQYLVSNAEMVRAMSDLVTDTNIATEQASTRTDTWSQKIKIQAAQFNDWTISLQENFGGLLNITQVAGQGADLLTKITTAGKGLATIGKGAFDAGTGVLKFGRTLKLISNAKDSGSAFKYAKAIAQTGTMGKIAAGTLSAYNNVMKAGKFLLSQVTTETFRNNVANRLSAFWTGIKAKATLISNGATAAWQKITSAATWTEMRKTIATKAHAVWTALSGKAMWVAGLATQGWSKVTQAAAFVQGGLTKALKVCRTTVITGILPALGGAITATWAWTVALLANPITWIVLAIGALVAAIVICWQHFAGFRAVLLTIWDTIKGFGAAIWDFLVSPFKSAWKIISGIGRGLGKLFTGDFKGMVSEFTDGFKDGFNTGVEGFSKGVSGVIDTAKGISGSYDMHLTEERAKQAEKDGKKETDKGNAGNTATAGYGPYMQGFDMTGPGMSVPNTQGFNMQAPDMSVPNTKGFNMQAPGMSGLDTKAFNTQAPGMSGLDTAGVKMPGFSAPAYAAPADGSGRSTGSKGSISSPERNAIDGHKTQQTAAPRQPMFAGLPGMEQNVNNIKESTTGNYQRTTHTANAVPAKIEVNFQPQINITAEMTQKSKEDLLVVLRRLATELTGIVEETQRRTGRGAYAIS